MVDPIYEGWQRVQDHLVARLPEMSTAELGLSATPDGWPVWALVAHLAGMRVYWLCVVCREPGIETTPFPDPASEGWEDHLEQPRSSSELLAALESTWAIVRRCLDTWTPKMLQDSFPRTRQGRVEHHTRGSVLTRMVMHDSFHCGEISMLFGQRGVRSLDPWEPLP